MAPRPVPRASSGPRAPIRGAAVARLITRGEAEATKVAKAAGKGQQTYDAVRLRDEATRGSSP